MSLIGSILKCWKQVLMYMFKFQNIFKLYKGLGRKILNHVVIEACFRYTLINGAPRSAWGNLEN
jgi:hypothetical protein